MKIKRRENKSKGNTKQRADEQRDKKDIEEEERMNAEERSDI